MNTMAPRNGRVQGVRSVLLMMAALHLLLLPTLCYARSILEGSEELHEDGRMARDWVLDEGGEWVSAEQSDQQADNYSALAGRLTTSSAAATGHSHAYPADCSPCNTTKCPGGSARRAPEKCHGRLELDRCGCCRICVKFDGQRCQGKRRPCDRDLVCYPSAGEKRIKRCHTVEGNCSAEHLSQGGPFRKAAPMCRQCQCSPDGRQLCRRTPCRPPLDPDMPADCVRQRCLERTLLNACCKFMYACRCTERASTPQPATKAAVMRTHPGCSRPASCPSQRNSGKNTSEVRYTYSAVDNRCVMHWQSARCTRDHDFTSLDQCRAECVPGAKEVIHAKKRDRCAVQTTAGQAACRFIQLHSRRALFRAVVQNVEQTELGVLYTLKIRNVYRGPCRKEVIYILADNSSMQTVCPYMETNFLYLIGYEMSVMNTNCRGVESVPVGSGASVRAEVLHSSERSTMVIPWRQDMWSFTDECMSARPSRHIPAPPPSSNQLPDHTAQ
eukprot:scpid35246/ scgid0652/ 